jgi:hypothetical protein
MDKYESSYLCFTKPLTKIYNWIQQCSTKPLSLLLTKILTAVKEKPQTYYATIYAKSGVNQMLILKHSKEL